MRIGLASAAALASLGLFSAGAAAAPQVLGVIASAGPIPLHCQDGTCHAELSAFCLQKERSIPEDGTAYEALDPEKLTLVVKGADGGVRTLPAGGLTLASRRSRVAVEVSLPESVARELGAVEVAVNVAPDLALVPVPEAGDTNPMRPAEVARARDALGSADALLASGDERAGMARLLNRLINALPGDTGADPAVADRAWQRVAGIPSRAPTTDPLLREAAQVFESCRLGLDDTWPSGLRRCLEFRHDAAMGGLNADIWKIIGTGS